MDKDLIKEILEYIEEVEEQIDGEWGRARNFEGLLKDHTDECKLIPDIYFKLKKLL